MIFIRNLNTGLLLTVISEVEVEKKERKPNTKIGIYYTNNKWKLEVNELINKKKKINEQR